MPRIQWNICEKWLWAKSWMNWYSITTKRIRTTKCTTTSVTKSTTLWHSTSTITWHFTTCTFTNSSTERAHVVLFFAHFITLTFGSSSSFVHTPSSRSSMWMSLHLELHSLLQSFLLVLLLLPILPLQRRTAVGAQSEDHGKLVLFRNQWGWGHLRRPLLHHNFFHQNDTYWWEILNWCWARRIFNFQK